MQLEYFMNTDRNLISIAQSHIITNNDQMSAAGDILGKLKIQLKQLTLEKEKETKPINEGLKAIRTKWARLSDPLENAINIITKSITLYKVVEAQQQAEIFAKVVDHSIDPLQAIASLTATNVVNKVITSTGSMTFMITYTLDIKDIEKIPYKYLVVNEPLLKKALMGGEEIEGARLIKNQVPVNRK